MSVKILKVHDEERTILSKITSFYLFNGFITNKKKGTLRLLRNVRFMVGTRLYEIDHCWVLDQHNRLEKYENQRRQFSAKVWRYKRSSGFYGHSLQQVRIFETIDDLLEQFERKEENEHNYA